MSIDEYDLINRLKKGDPDAFRELVERTQDHIVNTCFGFLHNCQDADDVAQTVYIELYQSINKFRGDSKLSTWLYRIAVNKSLNYLKSRKRRSLMQSIEDVFANSKEKDLPDSSESISDSLDRSEQMQVLHMAIQSLPKNQKIAIILNKTEELSYQEVADIMEISLSAVTALINRGIVNLRKKVSSFYKKSEKSPQGF